MRSRISGTERKPYVNVLVNGTVKNILELKNEFNKNWENYMKLNFITHIFTKLWEETLEKDIRRNEKVN
jgi:hypothetical protein